jgi:hypothetical protein
MNIAKNMEAIFVAAIVVASATTFATAAVPATRAFAPIATRVAAPAAAVVAKADTSAMQVVTVTAKRLSAAEKAAL